VSNNIGLSQTAEIYRFNLMDSPAGISEGAIHTTLDFRYQVALVELRGQMQHNGRSC
jgi:hypothetical protein